MPITFELMRRFFSGWIFSAGIKISARLLLDFFSNVETSATSVPLNLLLVLRDFSPDKLKFHRIRKSPRMVAVPLSVSHSLSHVAVARLGSALKILQLTHRVFPFAFPHCSAVGFRLNFARWPLRLLTACPLSNLTAPSPTLLLSSRHSRQHRCPLLPPRSRRSL